MTRIALALIVLGLFGGWQSFKTLGVAMNASSEPTEITCADLLKNGPPENSYIRITNSVPLAAFVFETTEGQQGNPMTARFSEVEQPIVPDDTKYADKYRAYLAAADLGDGAEADRAYAELLAIEGMAGPCVVIRSSNISSLAALQDYDFSSIEGMISTESLDNESQRILLQQSGLEQDWSEVIVIDQGETPKSVGTVIMWMVGSLLALIAGVTILIKGRGVGQVQPEDYQSTADFRRERRQANPNRQPTRLQPPPGSPAAQRDLRQQPQPGGYQQPPQQQPPSNQGGGTGWDR